MKASSHQILWNFKIVIMRCSTAATLPVKFQSNTIILKSNLVALWLHKIRWKAILLLNPLWPSDAIWQDGYGSTLAQVMACCLMATSHYLNQGWLIITGVQWHSPESNFTKGAQEVKPKHVFRITLLKSPPHLQGANVLNNKDSGTDFVFNVIPVKIWRRLHQWDAAKVGIHASTWKAWNWFLLACHKLWLISQQASCVPQ